MKKPPKRPRPPNPVLAKRKRDRKRSEAAGISLEKRVAAAVSKRTRKFPG